MDSTRDQASLPTLLPPLPTLLPPLLLQCVAAFSCIAAHWRVTKKGVLNVSSGSRRRLRSQGGGRASLSSADREGDRARASERVRLVAA